MRKLRAIFLLLIITSIVPTYAQIITNQIEVVEGTDTKIGPAGSEVITITPGKATIDGDLVVNGKLYFGGGTDSSYITHLEGWASPYGSTTFYIPIPHGKYFHIAVSIGGRSWDPFQLEHRVSGTMGGPQWMIVRNNIHVFGGMSITSEYDGNNSGIRFTLNNQQNNGASFTGYAVVSIN